MALHGVVSVNGKILTVWSATRINPTSKTPQPDTICTYEWEAGVSSEWPQLRATPAGRTVTGKLNHRYGDGANVLAAAILLAYERDRHRRPRGR